MVTPGSTEEAEARGPGVKVEVRLPLDVSKEIEARKQRKTVSDLSVSQDARHPEKSQSQKISISAFRKGEEKSKPFWLSCREAASIRKIKTRGSR